jgi:hypothetical protein
MAEYDTQQVCKNGHQITDGYDIYPEQRKEFCPDCGEATLTNCPDCDGNVQGGQFEVVTDWNGSQRYNRVAKPADVPSYCMNCGKPYPWTQKKIVTAIQILTEFGDLEASEKETIEQDVENIARDVPESELSAGRIARVLKRCGRVGYGVIMELASSTAAKILRDPC